MKVYFKLVAFIGAVLFPAVSFAAGGGISPNNVNTELRTQRFCVNDYQAIADADVTAGANGVGVIASLHTSRGGFTQTTSIAAFPYPSKLSLVIVDGGAATGALTCSSVVLTGFDQFGNSQSETVSSLSETAKESVKVYSRLSRIVGTGCNTLSLTTDSSDNFRVRAGTEIGLPYRINKVDAVLSVCVFDESASSGTQLCMKGGTSDGTLTFDNDGASNRVDTVYHSIELSGNIIANGAALADDDDICIRILAPGGAK